MLPVGNRHVEQLEQPYVGHHEPVEEHKTLQEGSKFSRIIINLLSQPRGADQAAYAHTVKAPAPYLSLGGGSDLQPWMFSVRPDRS
jgi:hypothetical protein